MNVQDFKAGLEKLRRECDDNTQKEHDDALRRMETRLALIFSAIQEAARKGEKHIVLGKHFGELDWNIVQVLYQSGCRSEPMYGESQLTNNPILTGYRIVWNHSK
jgi:hypothetical protein